MKKLTFISTILLFFAVNKFYCQERKNDELPKISRNIGQLSIAQGWFKDDSGQWIERKNKIISDLGTSTKLLENYEEYSKGQDNFIKLELKEIVINEIKYGLIVKFIKDGFYKYASIKEGWNSTNSIIYYVVDLKKLDEIRMVPKNVLNTIILETEFYGWVDYINIPTFKYSEIIKRIAADSKFANNGDKKKLGLNIAHFTEKNIVQFYLFDLDNETVEKSKNKYYETAYLNFNKLISLEK